MKKNIKTLTKEVWDHYNDKAEQKEIHWPNHTKQELERVMHHEMNGYFMESLYNDRMYDLMADFLRIHLLKGDLNVHDMERLTGCETEGVLDIVIAQLIKEQKYTSSALAVDLQRMINHRQIAFDPDGDDGYVSIIDQLRSKTKAA